ncbi:hypothetical protein A3Q56_00131 [Intoshia linei]|uniref:Tetratricopeptide repeat protein 7 N-terminal domain-containing protein n=1 Tax=Intoshia linei TaxID=1819745 RepID=A0A177BCR3_9BILA|nr:hypothetical protein A3Q56_00131 [Intoshia linei]
MTLYEQLSNKCKKFVSEIEIYRNQSNWLKTYELALEYGKKKYDLQNYAKLVSVESMIERYIQDDRSNKHSNENTQNWIDQLENIKKLPDLIKNGILDTNILLSKLFWYINQKSKSTSIYNNDIFNSNYSDFTPRNRKLLAESHAIQALILERNLTRVDSLPLKNCYKSCMCILMESINDGWNLDFILESVSFVSTYVLLNIDESNLLNDSIIKSRKMSSLLCSLVNYTSIYKATLEHLAKTLLFQITNNSYQNITLDLSQKSEITQNKKSATPLPIRSKIYIPHNRVEELYNVVLVLHNMITQDIVLIQDEKFEEIRSATLDRAISVSCLMALFMTFNSMIPLFQFFFSKIYAISSDVVFSNRLMVLSRISDGRFKEALQMYHSNPPNYSQDIIMLRLMVIACFRLQQYEDAFDILKEMKCFISRFSIINKKNIEIGHYIYLSAIGYVLLARCCKESSSKRIFYETSLKFLKRLTKEFPLIVDGHFYSSLVYGELGNVQSAFKHIQIFVQYKPMHSSGLHLMALLLTALHQYKKAFNTISFACTQHPSSLSLSEAKCNLFKFVSTERVKVLHEYLDFLKKQILLGEMSTLDSDLKNSEIESQVDGSVRKNTINTLNQHQKFKLMKNIKINISKTNTKQVETLDIINTAQTLMEHDIVCLDNDCNIEETSLIRKYNNLHFEENETENSLNNAPNWKCINLLGLHAISRQKYDEAIKYIDRALAIYPRSATTLYNMANLLSELSPDFNENTESYLIDAIAIEPYNAKYWEMLGDASNENSLKKSEYYLMSAKCYYKNPIQPYSRVIIFY